MEESFFLTLNYTDELVHFFQISLIILVVTILLIGCDSLKKVVETTSQEKGVVCKSRIAIGIDNSLLKHYGKHFDDIYYHYDYVHKCFRWSHDLVTLYYSDDQTDYPISWKLWEPPDWEAVAEFFRDKKFEESNFYLTKMEELLLENKKYKNRDTKTTNRTCEVRFTWAKSR